MQYYTFELDEESQKACTISTPCGNYSYVKMPMGCCQSSNFCQETMESLLQDIRECDVYIDDVGVFSNSWEHHIQSLQRILHRLQDNNFTINPLKCEWAVQETDFLGHWLTPTGIKPWKKKIDAILKLDRPRSIRDVRSFIGAVNFYRDMYPRRSHILGPLHELTGMETTKNFEKLWQPKHQKAFEAMKALMAKDAFIHYPDHNKPFHIYTDASDYQLGAVIMQEGQPVAFYSRKLNAAQCNYTMMEKELLSIIETLREFRTMIYGCCELHIHTDHKNLTYANLNSQWVMHWHLFLEEFNPQFHYIKGETNTLADALSRLPRKEDESVPGISQADSPVSHRLRQSMHANQNNNQHSFSIIMDDDEMLNCFLSFPEVDNEHPYALDFQEIANAQENDPLLPQLLQINTTGKYARCRYGSASHVELICRRENAQSEYKICIPQSMLDTLVSFYHSVLGHSGSKRVFDAMSLHFFHDELRERIYNLVSHCDACQRYKQPQNQYGELPERVVDGIPWNTVAVDTIGPWTLRTPWSNGELKFHALTIIDQVTNYCEIIRIDHMTAAHVAMQFENHWLARYPKPNTCIFDQGTEFKGVFREMLTCHGITHAGISVKKSTSQCNL